MGLAAVLFWNVLVAGLLAGVGLDRCGSGRRGIRQKMVPRRLKPRWFDSVDVRAEARTYLERRVVSSLRR